jgi:dihydroflavonol-4-reductase
MSQAILVTGGTGFLGRHVLEQLAAEGGADLRALVRRESRSLAKVAGVTQVMGDVEDAASLAAALEGVTHVYHLAGLVSRDPKDRTRMMRVHVDGTRHLFGAARAANVEKIVMASSSGTIAVSKDADVVTSESAPYALDVVKGWAYYLSKVYQEQVAFEFWEKHKLPVVVLNPSLLLGPGDQRGSSTDDVRKFLQRKIPIVPEGGVNFVDVRDVATAFLRAMEKGKPGERYLLGGPNWNFPTFFGRLERLSKVPAPRLRVPKTWARFGATLMEQVSEWRGVAAPVDRTSVEMSEHFWYVDSTKAERELGFVSRDPQETLLDTIRYLRKHFLAEGFEETSPAA